MTPPGQCLLSKNLQWTLPVCGVVGLHSSAVMAPAMEMCSNRWERRVLMCLTTHFTAKLLKSCAVYTPTFEYLSSGQFNYPGPSVISAALLSLSFAQGMRFVCGFIKIRRRSRFAGSTKKKKNHPCSSISYSVPPAAPVHIQILYTTVFL